MIPDLQVAASRYAKWQLIQMFGKGDGEGRASNSPALRGSLPPGHYFSRSPGKHVKSPHMNENNPVMHVKSPASGKTLENNCLANFQCNPKNHIYLSI